jgi:hypothetical protein
VKVAAAKPKGGAKKGAATAASASAADKDGIVQVSDPAFKEAFQVLSTNNGAGLSSWVEAKLNSDPRMSGKSARPRTRGQAKEEEEAEAKVKA